MDALTRVLEQAAGVRLAVVFGSEGVGAASRRSDIDIGVSLTGAIPASLGVDLERATGRPVDLVHLDTAPPLLRFEIARKGRVLFQREPHAWAEFKARAMIDWWDWAPTARMMHRIMVERLREEADRGSP